MTDINRLSSVDEVGAGDQVPVYSARGGATRKLPVTTLFKASNDAAAGSVALAQEAEAAARASADQAAATLADAAKKSELAAPTGAGEVGTPEGTAQDALNARVKIDVLAANTGALEFGFIQAGATAGRTGQAKLRDIVSVLDYVFPKGAAYGDGIVDDYAMVARAIAANPGKRIYFPDPPVRYRNATGKITLPAGTSLIGATRQTTQFAHEFNGDMFEMGDRASVVNFNLPGNGATYTGGCFVYSGTAGRQKVEATRAQDWDGPVQAYAVDAGSQCVNLDVIFARRNASTGTGRYAVVIDPTPKLTAVPRRFIGLETDGTCAIDFGGCNNVFVVASTIADIKYTPDSRGVNIVGGRLLNQTTLTFDGHNNVLGCADVLPQITIAPGADNNVIGPGSFNTLPIIDNSGNDRNLVYHISTAYTPTLGAGGTAPSLGNGTYTGRVARNGVVKHIEQQLVLGSTTTLGSGALQFGLPEARQGMNTFIGGTIVINRTANGGLIYIGTLVMTPGAAFATAVRDTSGSVTGTIPFALVAGDVIRIEADFI